MTHGTEENDAAVGESSALASLRERVEALFVEVRRQGRASIAAQAAAEACMKSLQQLQTSSPPSPQPSISPGGSATEVIERLLPVFDAIDGAAAEAKRLAALPKPADRGGLLVRWLHRVADGVAAPSTAGSSLANGVLLIQSELRRALTAVGVTIDDKVGARVDPERHRVVSVRKHSPKSQAIVLEVLRCGYAIAGTVLREADVVASDEMGPSAHGRNDS